jgi:type I restriction enzyme S subunit
VSSDFPSGWAEMPFGGINEFEPETINPANFPEETFELWSVPSFSSGKPEVATGSSIGSTKQLVKPNDVLICKINPRINRVWQVGKDSGLRQIASSEWIVLRSSKLVSGYLRHFFSSPSFREQICNEVTGVGGSLTRTQPKRVATFLVPIAPLNEQKLIADKLGVLLTQVDACRERLDRIPLILKRFRQAVLAAATSGQFTEDWREENFDIEPATNLVKEKRFTLAASDNNLPLLPNNWEWVALGNYAQCSRGRFSVRPRNDPAYFNGEHPFIQIGNLPSEGGWITGHKQTLNEKGLAVSKKFPKGTVVIAIVGATIGNTGILAYDMCFTDSMVGIDSGDEISNRYIELFLRHRKEEIRQTSYAGGGQPNIKLEVLNPYPLALPPLAEQHEIVCRVEVLFAYADSLEARYQAARNQVEHLTPALLAKAFRGELVPQDPNDEPASVLLERIRAERAAQPAKPKRSQVDRKQTMTKMTEESVKEAIRQLPKDQFSFDELRENLPGDYDSLKDILFALLSEAEPSLTQIFNREERTMCFVRGGK